MTEKEGPEKIKLYKYKYNSIIYYTSNPECGYMPDGLPSEYILKSVADKRVADAIKPVREVYEKYRPNGVTNWNIVAFTNDVWQAIKATVKQFKKENEEKAPS